jgi:hypothetical protein
VLQTPCLLATFLTLGTLFCVMSWLLGIVALGTKAFFSTACDTPHVHALDSPVDWTHEPLTCHDLASARDGSNAAMQASNALSTLANTLIAGEARRSRIIA